MREDKYWKKICDIFISNVDETVIFGSWKKLSKSKKQKPPRILVESKIGYTK